MERIIEANAGGRTLILLLNENVTEEAKLMASLAGLSFFVEPFPQGSAQRQAVDGWPSRCTLGFAPVVPLRGTQVSRSHLLQ
jgi:hypothetical protein